ncbi:MAG: hypothetical protein QNL04_12685 [SAR324 cluster bacterium]|nr:hypothetical protein [SAR324 cluster bacterium]
MPNPMILSKFRFSILFVFVLSFLAVPQVVLAKGKTTQAFLITTAIFSAAKASYDGKKYNGFADENKLLAAEYLTTKSTKRLMAIETLYSGNLENMRNLKKQINLADQITLTAIGVECFILFVSGIDSAISEEKNWEITPIIAYGNSGIHFNVRF